VAASLPVDGNDGALARAGRRQHDDAAQLLPAMEQGSSRVMLARPRWSGRHQTRRRRRSALGPVTRRGFGQGGSERRAVGPSFSRAHGDTGHRFAQPIRAGRVAA
jgi:hypothetical protein